MVGFKRTAGAFSIFLLNQYMAGVAYSSQSRLLTAISSDQDMAFRLNGLLIIPSIVYSGYFIPYSEMKPWFVWLYWIVGIFLLRPLIGNLIRSPPKRTRLRTRTKP